MEFENSSGAERKLPTLHHYFNKRIARRPGILATAILTICFIISLIQYAPSIVYHNGDYITSVTEPPASLDRQRDQLDPVLVDLTPEDLIRRTLYSDSSTPKIIHRQWASNLPTQYVAFESNCRKLHYHWQWVTWTPEDDMQLLNIYFPWFLATYKRLRSDSQRADVMRNIYMFLFGGMFVDLTMDCLKPFDNIFNERGIKLADYGMKSPPMQSDGTRKALFGSSDTGMDKQRSIPNLWMASPPAHPFYLLSIDWLNQRVLTGERDASQEALTGSIALYQSIKAYQQKANKRDGKGLNSYILENEYLIPKGVDKYAILAQHDVVVLPARYIYPCAVDEYELYDDTLKEVCSLGGFLFDTSACQRACGISPTSSYAFRYIDRKGTRE